MTARIDSSLFIEIAFLLLRIAAGLFMLIFHGWKKLTGAVSYVFEGSDWGFITVVDKLGLPLPEMFAILAAISESIIAVLLAVGLFTRASAFFLGTTMAVAFYRHASSDWNVESALLYLFVFLLFLAYGAGKYSLDQVIQGKQKDKNPVTSAS